jgi:hypothetical protein
LLSFEKNWLGNGKIWTKRGNPLGTQYLVPVGRVANLGSEVMRNLFFQHNQFLQNTKMKLFHNLNDMDEILSLDLNEHVDLDP